MNETQVAIPLGIPDVRVLQTSVSEPGAIVITIESTKGGTRCRKCGKWLTQLHGQEEWVTIRHLSVFGRPTFLRYRPHPISALTAMATPSSNAWNGTMALVSWFPEGDAHRLSQG